MAVTLIYSSIDTNAFLKPVQVILDQERTDGDVGALLFSVFEVKALTTFFKKDMIFAVGYVSTA